MPPCGLGGSVTVAVRMGGMLSAVWMGTTVKLERQLPAASLQRHEWWQR